jgi:hypothetical protein
MADAKPMDRKSRAKRKAARAKKRAHKTAKKASSQKESIVELNIDSLFDAESTKYLHGLFTPTPMTIQRAQYPPYTVPSTQQQQAGPSEPTSDDVPERLNSLLKSHLKYVRGASVLRAEDKHSFIAKSRELASADMDKLTRARARNYKDTFFGSLVQNSSITKVKKIYLHNIDKYIEGHWADPPNMNVIEHPVYSKSLDETSLKAAMVEHGLKPTKNMAVTSMLFELGNAGADVDPMT